ncbi:ABC transporter permease [Peptoniphilus equinus]|uniref:ABC transporter permease n=1 Tax=Peptoniphilus equinus TaxID=3016343 RepID=A0ABY7QTP3_9FIRM|nr:ABC transporter permease [Peptoniphilus equinus]WBW49726.1 ABC transporter permease [Peptoniphilus equinus]
MKKFANRALLALVFIFLYAPIVTLMVYSFNNSRLRGRWAGFTLKWYQNLFENPTILEALKNTLVVAVIATLVATILGTVAAIGIYEMRGRSKQALLNMNYIPVLNPDIVTAVALMGLFGLFQLKFGLLTLTMSHIVFCTPYVVLSVLPKLTQMNDNTVEAALDLGATPREAMTHVIIPQIKPGIVTGALMAFTLSLDDFVVSYFTTGHGVSNLSITIYTMARKGINPSINAISTIMFVVLLVLLVIINKKTMKEEEV